MKSSVSAPSTSRKYSACVSAVSPTRAREPGRLVHLPVDEHGFREHRRASESFDSCISRHKIVAFAAALAYAAEHRHAAVLFGDVVDQLQDDDGFADAGAAEEPDLAALLIGLEEIDRL